MLNLKKTLEKICVGLQLGKNGFLHSSGRKAINTSASIVLASVTLQPNTWYLILATCNSQTNFSGVDSCTISFNGTLDESYGAGYTRGTGVNGGGINAWKVARTGANTVVASVTTYGYDRSHEENGDIVAIPFAINR